MKHQAGGEEGRAPGQIHLARFLPRSVSGVNGPGQRAVIWVQGCPLRCPGCFNPAFLPFGGHHAHVRTLSVQQVIDLVLQEHHRQALDGVTFSGGEPFSHADELASVAEVLRTHGLTVVVFTGATYSVLQRRRDAGTRRLLAQTDLLVAGPYLDGLPMDMSKWKGSMNQTLVELTGRIQPESDRPAHVEVLINDDGIVTVTGFPNRGLRRRMDDLYGHIEPASLTTHQGLGT